MRFFIGKHYEDASGRITGPYVASPLHTDAGNLVAVIDGGVYFSDDNLIYMYDGLLCFDATSMLEGVEFVEVSLDIFINPIG